ncbi:MAG: AI-2E family transporter, partial [Coprococcus sp.]
MLEWKTCIRGGVTVLLVYLLIHYWSSLSGIVRLAVSAAVPLILGCVIAYIVNILMSFYERYFLTGKKNEKWQRIRRPVCMLLSFLTVVLVIFLIIRMIIPELVDCIRLVLDQLPDAMNSLYAWAENNLHISEWLSEEAGQIYSSSFQNTDWQEVVKKVLDWLMTGVGGAMASILTVVTSLFSTAVTVLVAFVFSIYLLLGKERLSRQCGLLIRTYCGEKVSRRVLYVLSTFNQSFHSFIVGQCLEAVILGGLCTIGMLILGFPYATMIGCLIGFTALIPVAGAYIGAGVGCFMIFTVSPLKAILFLVFIVVLQQLEGNLIYPRVVGASIGLPGIWVLAAVTVGGGILG